jgi:TPR repeat protein
MSNLGNLLFGRGGDDNVAEAESLYRQGVELGDAIAMANLGFLLRDRGGADNVAEAEHWFEEARERGVELPQ